ncbi:Zinc finger protein DZIP1L [Tupaia chinensis]|uniref:Zinc finger protein DZIP1L n=1 Tax=Tupaia chinensis TaxID=246437 RepID=L9JDE1_TUPCH|nr:Zinc finger protein DZIP1L [Tupaia chinensis]
MLHMHGRLGGVEALAQAGDSDPHLCDRHTHSLPLWCSTMSVHATTLLRYRHLLPAALQVCSVHSCLALPNLDPLLSFQAFSRLFDLLPWPWWCPSPVVSPGLPPPMQSSVTTAEGLSSPLFGAHALPTFKFQPRRETVDWRRISALDVDRVARELDVATLQENIAGVTFCNLDREACSRCGQPVDPVLLKVLRLAQLTIEYLLHCQDCLSASVAQLEARLQASLGQQQRGQQELGRQASELKGCHLCDKTFMNATFLRGHIQRRHAGTAEAVEEVLEELRAKLKWTQGELEAQREAERQWQLQEAKIAQQREIEAKKEFDEWKEQERMKLYGEIDKLKKLFWDEFRSVANQNCTLEEKLQALQSHSVVESNLGSLRDEESEERLRQAQELQALREKMEVQLQEENERLQATLSQDQRKAAAQAQRQVSVLRAQLQEQARLIASQEETIRTLSLGKVEEIREVPKPVDTEEDSPEEELESSGGEQQKVLAALRRNPTLLKQFRPILEDTLEEKLESLGIKTEAKGISAQKRTHLESLLRVQREQQARRFPEFPSLREQLIKEATRRVKEKLENGATSRPEGQPADSVEGCCTALPMADVGLRRPLVAASPSCKGCLHCGVDGFCQVHLEGCTPRCRHAGPSSDLLTPEVSFKGRWSTPVTKEARPQTRPQHGTLPAKLVETPTSTLQSPGSCGPDLTQGSTPTPRPRAHRPASTPASPGPGLSTPPFSSEEDSEEDSVQRVSLQPPATPARMVPRLQADWDWSDTESSEGNAQPPGKGSGGLASSGTLVQSMVRNLEKQLEAPAKKPAGGIRLFSKPDATPQRAAMPGGKPQRLDTWHYHSYLTISVTIVTGAINSTISASTSMITTSVTTTTMVTAASTSTITSSSTTNFTTTTGFDSTTIPLPPL